MRQQYLNVGVDDELHCAAGLVVDAVGLGGSGDIGLPHPGAVGEGDDVAGGAVHPELVPLHQATQAATGQRDRAVVEHVHARHVDEVARGQRDRVVAGVGGEVDLFDALDPAEAVRAAGTDVGDGRQVQPRAATQAQRVDAAAAEDARDLTASHARRQRRGVGGVQHEHVMTRAAHHHVGATAAGDGVAARPGDEGLGRRGAHLLVVRGVAQEVHRRGELLPAEDDVGAAGSRQTVRAGVPGSDDQVRKAVAVDVAGRTDPGRPVAGHFAIDDKATAPRSHGRQVDRRRPRPAEDHIAAPGIGASARIGHISTDDDVGQTVAVDVTRRGDGGAQVAAGVLAVDDEAAAAAQQRGHFDRRRASAAAEHDESAARLGPGGRTGVMGGDREVRQPVAVDIAHGGHHPARAVAGALAVDHEAADAGGHGGQVHRLHAGAAEDDIGAPASVQARRICHSGTHQDVGQTVAVDVARGGHHHAAEVARALPVDDEAADAGADIGRVEGGERAAAEDDVGATGVRARRRVGIGCREGQIGQAVAVDVAQRRHRHAEVVATLDGVVDRETAGPARHDVQVDVRGRRATEHHVGPAGLGGAGRGPQGRGEEEVGQAVAVDVAGGGGLVVAEPVVRASLAVDRETATGSAECREFDRAAGGGATEDHVDGPVCAVGQWRRDDDVIETVPVDVARGGHAVQTPAVGRLTVHREAADAAGDG